MRVGGVCWYAGLLSGLRAGVNARQTRQMPRAAGQRGRQTAAT